jgi:hypothetical protein
MPDGDQAAAQRQHTEQDEHSGAGVEARDEGAEGNRAERHHDGLAADEHAGSMLVDVQLVNDRVSSPMGRIP